MNVRFNNGSWTSASCSVQRHRRRFLFRAVWVLALMAGLGGLNGWQAHQAVVRARAVAASPLAVLQATSLPQPEPLRRQSLLDALPLAAPTWALLQGLQRASQSAGVTLMAVSVAQRPAQERQPGRAEIRLTLRGGYPQLRALISHTAADPSAPILHRLAMQRTDTGTDVEAQVDWWLPTRVMP
jgi:Tfp pilus assembly protein PilO